LNAAFGLGSNLGDRAAHLDLAVEGLKTLGPVVVSSYHETEPVGPPQPRYLNAAAVVVTDRSPAELLALCSELEARAGRVRTPGDRWGPRTLDVDLLLYGDEIIETEDLAVPHEGLAERLFVLAPLAEIAPDRVVPGTGRTVAELHADYVARR